MDLRQLGPQGPRMRPSAHSPREPWDADEDADVDAKPRPMAMTMTTALVDAWTRDGGEDGPVLSWRPPLRPSWGSTVNGQQRTDGMAASHSAAMPSSRDPGVAKHTGGVESGPERPPCGEEDGDEGDRRWESAGDSPRTVMGKW